MTYNSFELSAHDGGPVEGYHFSGTAGGWRYTNAQRDVTIDGLAYTAAFIKRAAIRAGTHTDDALELEVELPFETPLIQAYAFSPSLPDLSLTVYRYHEDSDPAVDWVVVWRGRVTTFNVAGEVAKIRVPSVFELALRGAVPSAFYHGPCNHVLYDVRCKAVVQQTVTTVTSVTGGGLTIGVTNDGFADSYLKAGTLYLPAKGERRLIQSNVANILGISFAFFNIDNGDQAVLVVGCDHAYQGDCKVKHNNTLNFGGFPYVPAENPFEGSL